MGAREEKEEGAETVTQAGGTRKRKERGGEEEEEPKERQKEKDQEKTADQNCSGSAVLAGALDGEEREMVGQGVGGGMRDHAGSVGDLLRFLGEVLRVLHLRREWAGRSPSESLFRW